MNDVRRFRIIGRTTDGRKWASFVNYAPEFIEDMGFRFLMFIAMSATDWDEEHDCQTHRLTFEHFPMDAWELMQWKAALMEEEDTMDSAP